MTTQARKGKGEPAFEDRLKRLEEIVSALEKGEADLKETLTLFEEGRDLTRGLVKELDEAERKVELLVKDAEGNPATEPLNLPATGEGEGHEP